jgi:hypothetical protein
MIEPQGRRRREGRCSICGRDVNREGAIAFAGVCLCSVCEAITIAIRPGYPLYRFWADLLRLALVEAEGGIGR